MRVKDSEQGYFLTLCQELLRHFKSNKPAKGIAPQEVGSLRLYLFQDRDIGTDHLFKRAGAALAFLNNGGILYPIHRSVWTQIARQIIVAAHITTGRMNTEERRFVTSGLNWHRGDRVTVCAPWSWRI